MAIIKCPHCGKNASDKDRKCPNCDFELDRDELACIYCGSTHLTEDTENYFKDQKKTGCLFVILGIFLAPFGGNGIFSKSLTETGAEAIGKNTHATIEQLRENGMAIYRCRDCGKYFTVPEQKASDKK